MSRRTTRRKCRCCREFFVPDYRNVERQHYCAQPACRQASKTASQRRWSRKTENHDYFRDKRHVERVQEWRRAHPGYWRKQKPQSQEAQPLAPQPLNPGQGSCNAPNRDLRTLQDLWLTEHPAFVGLISMVTGSTLQDDIDATSRRLIIRGLNILGRKVPENDQTTMPICHDPRTPDSSRATAQGGAQLQLG
jgi:hypothetical protein